MAFSLVACIRVKLSANSRMVLVRHGTRMLPLSSLACCLGRHRGCVVRGASGPRLLLPWRGSTHLSPSFGRLATGFMTAALK
jgi:hypothetical protein